MSRSEYKPNPIKITLLGDRGVGKSSLILRFCSYDSLASNAPPQTTEAESKKTEWFLYRKTGVATLQALELLDVPGEKSPEAEHSDLLKSHLSGSTAIMIVFDINNKESFDSAKSFWLPKAQTQNVPIVLVGHSPTKARAGAPAVQEEDIDAFCGKPGNENVTYVITGHIDAQTKTQPDDVVKAFKTAGQKALPIATIAQEPGVEIHKAQSVFDARKELMVELSAWATKRESQKKDTIAEALRSFAAFFPGGGYNCKEKIEAATKFSNNDERKNLSDREIEVLLQPNSGTGDLFSAAELNSSNIRTYTPPAAEANQDNDGDHGAGDDHGDSDDDGNDAGAGAGAGARR